MKLSGTALGRSLEPPTSRKFTWCVMERVKSSLFSSHCPHWLVSLVSNTCISSMCPCYLSLYILFPLPAITYLLCSFIPCLSLSPFIPYIPHLFIFSFLSFNSFLYKLLSVSPSRPLAPPSLSPCQSANSLAACSFSSSAKKTRSKVQSCCCGFGGRRGNTEGGQACVKTDSNIVLNRWNFNLIRHHISISEHVSTCKLDEQNRD